MDCFICDGKTSVVNSRPQLRLKQVWRRRLCKNCGYIFTTIEKIDLERSMMVKFNNQHLEEFVREKILISIRDSLGHHKDPINDSIAITDTIISKLYKNNQSPLIDRNNIVKTTLEVLKHFDKASYIHYQAYHKLNEL